MILVIKILVAIGIVSFFSIIGLLMASWSINPHQPPPRRRAF